MGNLNDGADQDKNASANPDNVGELIQQQEDTIKEPKAIDPLEAAVAEKQEAEKREAAKEDLPDGGLLGGDLDKDGAKPDEGKDEAKKDESGKDAVPDYKFTLPDGFIENETAMASFKELAKTHGMKQEQAQAMLDAYIDIERKRNASLSESLSDNSRKWRGEVKNHPEFGGRNLQSSMEGANAVVRKFGSPLMVSQMREMHIQDWPEMFYLLARVHKALGEDVSHGGESGGGVPSKEESLKGMFPGIKT